MDLCLYAYMPWWLGCGLGRVVSVVVGLSVYGSCGSLWLYVRAVLAVAAAVGGCFDCLLLQGPTFFCFFSLAA